MSKQSSPNTQWRLRVNDELEDPSDEHNDTNISFSTCERPPFQRKFSPFQSPAGSHSVPSHEPSSNLQGAPSAIPTPQPRHSLPSQNSVSPRHASSPDFMSSPSPRSTASGLARVGSWNNTLISETASDAPSFTGNGLRNCSEWNKHNSTRSKSSTRAWNDSNFNFHI